jgi:chaperonin cofactor prefoldin
MLKKELEERLEMARNTIRTLEQEMKYLRSYNDHLDFLLKRLLTREDPSTIACLTQTIADLRGIIRTCHH